MKEIVEYLYKSGIQYFATIGLDERPKVRPFQFMFEENGKLWFCTSNQKKTYQELLNQPYIELCASGENMSWIRLKGKVIFSDNLEVKKKILEVSPLVNEIYKVPENPSFEVFYLDRVTASIAELGKTAQIYKF